MGKKKGRTFKVQKAPPHKGPVILTEKPMPAWWRPVWGKAIRQATAKLM